MCIDVHSDKNVCNKNDLFSTVVEVDEEMKDNNIKSTTHLCHICKEKIRISKTVSSKNKYQKRKLQI